VVTVLLLSHTFRGVHARTHCTALMNTLSCHSKAGCIASMACKNLSNCAAHKAELYNMHCHHQVCTQVSAAAVQVTHLSCGAAAYNCTAAAAAAACHCTTTAAAAAAAVHSATTTSCCSVTLKVCLATGTLCYMASALSSFSPAVLLQMLTSSLSQTGAAIVLAATKRDAVVRLSH
jgi:hypothetical protein